MRVETATVEAADASSRMRTLEKAGGTFVAIVTGPDIKRCAEVEVDDTSRGGPV